MARNYIKWTKEKIIQYINDNNYIFIKFISDFNGRKTRIEIWCGNPKHESYKINFSNFLLGNRCRQCENESRIGNTHNYICYEEVKKYIELYNYSLLTKEKEYKNCLQPLKIKCDKGHITDTLTFSNFKNNGYRCSICANNIKHDYEFVKEKFEEKGYELLSTEYKHSNSPLIVKCKNGHITDTLTFSNFYSKGCECNECKESKGEKIISEILTKINIDYNIQHRFEDCKFKYTLPFDFYIPSLKIAIEFDGEQHYKIIEWFGGLEGFVNTKIRDTIKNIYCQQNNIKLIRIPYSEINNIENILIKELNL